MPANNLLRVSKVPDRRCKLYVWCMESDNTSTCDSVGYHGKAKSPQLGNDAHRVHGSLQRLRIAPPALRACHLSHKEHSSPLVNALAVAPHANHTLWPGPYPDLFRWTDAPSWVQARRSCQLTRQEAFAPWAAHTSELTSDGSRSRELRDHLPRSRVSGRQSSFRR